MATPTSSSPVWFYAASLPFGVFRAVVGTPLDVIATRQVLKGMDDLHLRDYWRGFTPNLAKLVMKTPLQVMSADISSRMVPTQLDPGVRGIAIGVLSPAMEALFTNSFNSIRTRFIQGEGWAEIRNEGVKVLTYGSAPALAHRAVTAAVFWGTYEKLRNLYPSQEVVVSSTMAGFVQVVFTAPFYIAAIHKQSKDAKPEQLYSLIRRLYQTHGLARGLILPALGPRLIHTVLTTAPLMWLLEKARVIHR